MAEEKGKGKAKAEPKAPQKFSAQFRDKKGNRLVVRTEKQDDVRFKVAVIHVKVDADGNVVDRKRGMVEEYNDFAAAQKAAQGHANSATASGWQPYKRRHVIPSEFDAIPAAK